MLVVIKGAGDIATGIALRLHRVGIRLVMTEIAQPTAIRRTVCFSTAVSDQKAEVEGVEALLAADPKQALEMTEHGSIAVLVDPCAECVQYLRPDAVVDAILAKKNLGTSITDAPRVIGVGPGFVAGVDCHAVVETMRGHSLGRVLLRASAAPNTGIPGEIGGYSAQRLLRAPVAGIFRQLVPIGSRVEAGDQVAEVSGQPVVCEIAGVLRGILPNGIVVPKGIKCGDVDPRCELSHCYTVSDKALAVAGGVLEALLSKEIKRESIPKEVF